jgi:hypothetical protein
MFASNRYCQRERRQISPLKLLLLQLLQLLLLAGAGRALRYAQLLSPATRMHDDTRQH